jgi:riboflavin kinase / FMN adenylyltransferase
VPPASHETTNTDARSVVVIGNFDGVHLGHQAVVRAAVAEARENGLRPRALTFDPHPQEVLGRGARPMLTRLERKLALLSRLGIEVTVEPFTAELAALSPKEFATRVLASRLRAHTILVGENFRFGRGRSGDLTALAKFGHELGFTARAVVLAGDDEGLFSSTRVRAALALGDLASAERCLGRPHSVVGTVTRGDGRGRTIGVPTANLGDVVEVLPPNGVYACLVDREDAGTGQALSLGVANLGVRPTVSGGFSVEVHLLDFDGDLYGARLRVHFVRRLRDELKFENLAALTAQIGQDIAAARQLLSGRNPDPAAQGAWV